MACNVTDECAVGLILPLMDETGWNVGLRVFLYLIGLLWCFLGVAIIADVFMCSIEKITSHTKKIRIANPDAEGGIEEIEVKVWNDTVANLTLMALGSSAPEILLSVIEIVGNGFESGELGPSTIVGSAAFNLLVIIAVCIISIPSPDTRTIKSIKVFAVTSFFSVFAYVWLIIILMVITPNYVELWEAVITFLMFPVMVIVAYMCDKDYCGKKATSGDGNMELGFVPVAGDDSHYIPWHKHRTFTVNKYDPDNSQSGKTDTRKMREFIKELRKIHPNLSEDEIAQLAAARISEEQNHSGLWYRINATRKMGGGHKLTPQMNEELSNVFNAMKSSDDGDLEAPERRGSLPDLSENGRFSVLEFSASQKAVLEGEGKVTVEIERYGLTDKEITFRLETIDGTAEANSDYKPVKKDVTLAVGQSKHVEEIEIIDDNDWEPDEVFFVKIALKPDHPAFKQTRLGQRAITEITIVNDDEPGTFEFSKPSLLFKESVGIARIPVERTNGADGKVTVNWKTEDMSAISGTDYEGGEGELVFEHGEMMKTIEVQIHDDQEPEKDECFKLDLISISPEGAKLGRICKTIVTVVNDDDFNGMISRLVDMTNTNMDALRMDTTSWSDQFRNAMNVNGGQVEGASNMDYVMHFMTFFWKIFFALVPPVSIWGGWLTFVAALAMIAILTAVVGDLAEIFGCLIDLKPSVTAITFVALGTSLPDLFASKQAATQEKTADNSIGNVTGSNSVNVFLGLGMPWLMASIYWSAQGKTFKVEAGSLGFSVVIYSVCACTCIFILMLRRYIGAFGAELGGNKILKYVCAAIMVLLWVFYVLMSAFQAYDHIKVSF